MAHIKTVVLVTSLALLLGLAAGAIAQSASAGARAQRGAGGLETAADPPGATAGRDLSDAEASRVLDFVFGGRPRHALLYLDSLRTRAGGEPLYSIMRARCNQEFIPMDDAGRGVGQALSGPALEDLDRCIDVCTKRLEMQGADSVLFFYRGWAWMAKAYVRSLTRDLFTAGKEAKKGKKDLERYLASFPDDPTATGLMGAFLYFADTIPSAFKLISKILLLPTGDRSKGLEYLDIAARKDGLLQTDWKLILYNVYFYFEGRFEEGLAGLEQMIGLYPEYARTAIPLAISRPYTPFLAVRNDELVSATINRIYSAPHREVDWNALYLLQLFRASGDRYCNHSSTTVARLKSIIHESPDHPDWVEGQARLELGRLYASQGRRDDAVAMFKAVTRRYTLDFLRKEAEVLLEDIDKFADRFEEPPLPNTDSWVATLYRGDPDSVRVIRSRFEGLASRSIAARFYLAECDLFDGDFEMALQHFNGVISNQAPAWDHAFQMMASTRIAEIYASRGLYEKAARYQGVALRYYHNEYLLDWVMEGRKKYFERLDEGKETGAPTFLTTKFLPAHPATPRGSASTTPEEHN